MKVETALTLILFVIVLAGIVGSEVLYRRRRRAHIAPMTLEADAAMGKTIERVAERSRSRSIPVPLAHELDETPVRDLDEYTAARATPAPGTITPLRLVAHPPNGRGRAR